MTNVNAIEGARNKKLIHSDFLAKLFRFGTFCFSETFPDFPQDTAQETLGVESCASWIVSKASASAGASPF